jgi:hypothetical protein
MSRSYAEQWHNEQQPSQAKQWVALHRMFVVVIVGPSDPCCVMNA